MNSAARALSAGVRTSPNQALNGSTSRNVRRAGLPASRHSRSTCKLKTAFSGASKIALRTKCRLPWRRSPRSASLALGGSTIACRQSAQITLSPAILNATCIRSRKCRTSSASFTQLKRASTSRPTLHSALNCAGRSHSCSTKDATAGRRRSISSACSADERPHACPTREAREQGTAEAR